MTDKPTWTEQDDVDIGYGEEFSQDANSFLAEIKRLYPQKRPDEIRPNWSNGVPTKFKMRLLGDRFSSGKVQHQAAFHWMQLDLDWTRSYSLDFLSDNPRYLPGNYTSEWSGVYRIFAKEKIIHRCCGEDSTGTLYIGCAASRGRNWSTLRTRIQSILRGDHHAMMKHSFSDLLQQKFPREILAVDWAYTGTRVNYKGEIVPNVLMAESLLLSSYNDSYGEYPPWNQKG